MLLFSFSSNNHYEELEINSSVNIFTHKAPHCHEKAQYRAGRLVVSISVTQKKHYSIVSILSTILLE